MVLEWRRIIRRGLLGKEKDERSGSCFRGRVDVVLAGGDRVREGKTRQKERRILGLLQADFVFFSK